MVNKAIKIGYKVGSGEKIEMPISHLIVTGLTAMAGKTTTLESFIQRSGRKAVVFRTKVGEKSFLSGTIIPPYFKDRSDWQFIEGLIESTMKEKVGRFERAKIIQICKQSGSNSLIEFKKKVDQRLLEPKLNNFERDILTNLQAYLEIVIPKLLTIQFSKELTLAEGLNIVDLERFSRDSEVQSLIIRSVLEEVLYNFKDTIVIIPEAWKFIPQDRGNPCKLMVEEFIRQGATNGNYIWIDSQDMSGVDKTPLKQISEWILGYQSEKNEVKHTLDQIPLPKAVKPKEDDIMSLGKGIFYFASRDLTAKVYVQPFWLDDERAIKIAKGELLLKDLDVPAIQTEYRSIPIPPPAHVAEKTESNGPEISQNELTELRNDFFAKLVDIQNQVGVMTAQMHEMNSRMISMQPKPIDEAAIVAKVLQKVPINITTPIANVNHDELIKEILSKIPTSPGGVTYNVSPLEKIKRDFLDAAKNKIVQDVAATSPNSKIMLKYLEALGRGSKTNEIEEKCFMQKDSGGGRKKVLDCATELLAIEVIRKDKNAVHYGDLKARIQFLTQDHDATDAEIEQVYQHILMEILK